MLSRIVRVDLTTGKVSEQRTPKEYEGLGGRGLTSTILHDEVNPRCDPLGPENKLVIAPGFFGGSMVPNSGRLSIGAKSPLTGGIKESNMGGVVGQLLAAHGIQALVIEGAATSGVMAIEVSDEGVTVGEFDGAPMAGNYEVADLIQGRHEDLPGILSVGPAGMRRMLAAGISGSDLERRPSRYAGRGGLGAVMGAKGLKAVVVRPSGQPRPGTTDVLKAAIREFAGAIKDNPTVGLLRAQGTAGIMDIACDLGSFPTHSFTKGAFHGFANINGARLAGLQKERGGKVGHRCMSGCVVACSNVYLDEGGAHLTSALEYETLCLMGSNLDIDDIDAIAGFDRACDDVGLDPIELGATIGVAMDEGRIPYGDADRVAELIHEIGKGTAEGHLYGNGVVHLAREIGAKRVPAAMGQGYPGHDSRTFNGVGVTYITSPMGPDHTAGLVFNPDKENAVELSREHQIYAMLCDTLGLCLFVSQAVEDLAKIYSAFVGKEVKPEVLRDWAIQLLRTEVSFNDRAGVPPIEKRGSEIFRNEPLPESGNLFDTPLEAMKTIFDD